MSERVLFVDDEPHVLDSFRRLLRGRFTMDFAQSAAEGLRVLELRGPFAVIVSDLRMPGMDGVAFFAAARHVAPDAVRIMLTGQADLDAAINAVNEGNLFRFLTKPCPATAIGATVEAGLVQYRLVCAERDLLERTLRSAIRVLSGVLGLAAPSAFGRASRVRATVARIAEQAQLEGVWRYEIAAMLSQIGCVALPPALLDDVYAGRPIAPEQADAVSGHPRIAADLIAEIPRLEEIAQMVARQAAPVQATCAEWGDDHPVAIGALLLRLALALDERTMRGRSWREALDDPAIVVQGYPHWMLEAARAVPVGEKSVERLVTVRELTGVMTAAEDIRAKSGLLLVASGQEITVPVIERLISFALGIGVVEPFRVEDRSSVQACRDVPVAGGR